MIKKIRKKFKKVNSQKGFTLLEILVVLTIMGFLIAMVAPRLAGISGSAVDTVCDSNQNRMITYMSSFYEKMNRYPNKLTNLVIVDGSGGTYQIPTVSNQNPDDEAEVLAAEFNDRNHFHIHILNSDEANEIKNMGIVKLLNLNDYSGMDDAAVNEDVGNDVTLNVVLATNQQPSMTPKTPAKDVGVAMIGCGCTTNADTSWVATNATERGWGEPDWFGRIMLGMGPECGLITSGVISNAAHCPGGIQNADNVTYNDYNLVLPRLEATSARMEDASLDTAIPGIAGGDVVGELTCVQYDDDPNSGAIYDTSENGDNLKVRSFDITAAMEKWQFATQCPEGHAYPEDDGEFWGIDLAATLGSIDVAP